MPTDLFLGGLASLILAAIIIVAMTPTKRGKYPDKGKDCEDRKKTDLHGRSGW